MVYHPHFTTKCLLNASSYYKPDIAESEQIKLTGALKDILPAVVPKKPKSKPQKKPKKKSKDNNAAPSNQPTPPNTAVQPSTTSQIEQKTSDQQSIWRQFCVGVNSVTRGIENDQMRSITICPLPSAHIGSLFGKKSIAAVAIKKQLDWGDAKIDEFVGLAESLLRESMERVAIPWLATNTILHELKTRTVGRKRGRDGNNNNSSAEAANVPAKKTEKKKLKK